MKFLHGSVKKTKRKDKVFTIPSQKLKETNVEYAVNTPQKTSDEWEEEYLRIGRKRNMGIWSLWRNTVHSKNMGWSTRLFKQWRRFNSV